MERHGLRLFAWMPAISSSLDEMMMWIAILMGFLAAIGWGAADYLAGATTKLVGVKRTALFTQSAGWFAVTILLAAMPTLRERAVAASWSAWGCGLVGVSLNVMGALALLRAFSVGRASLIAPLVTGYAAVTALLGLVTGEAMSGLRLAGIVICLIGAPMAAAKPGSRQQLGNEGVGFAVAAALFFGTGFWVQGRLAVPALGAAPVLWLFFSAGIALVAPVLIVRREPMLPQRSGLPLLLFQSHCNLAAYGAFAIGMTTGSVTIVTVLSTLSAGITALLGVLLRREKLPTLQGTGVAAVLAGAIILSI